MSDPTSESMDLCRAMEDGLLVPRAYELALHQLADVLSGLLLAMPGLGVAPPSDVVCAGDSITRKLARLMEGVAELKGQAVELVGIARLLSQYVSSASKSDADALAIYAALQLISEKLRPPYIIISADGVRRGAPEGDPRIVDLSWRSLAVDDAHDAIWRSGQEISLRRVYLLRRFLLLFAMAPHEFFSKEDVFRFVWGGEYHPLRNDPALFTSVVRIRRLLGEDGGDLLRSVEGGYRFLPPPDFLCVVKAESLTGDRGRSR